MSKILKKTDFIDSNYKHLHINLGELTDRAFVSQIFDKLTTLNINIVDSDIIRLVYL